MRTYHAQATVRNGQLILAEPLPQELEGQELSFDLNVDNSLKAPSQLTQQEFEKRLHAMSGLIAGPPIPDEAIRREHLY